jgi:PAS domain S-box-containing protein
LVRSEQRPYDKSELLYVSSLANLLAVAIGNSQILEDTLHRERFYAALGRVTLAISATVELQPVLDLICQDSLALFNIDGAYIWLVRGDELLALGASGHAHQDFVGTRADIISANHLAATIARTGEGIICNNYQDSRAYDLGLSESEEIQAALGIPLRFEEESIGVLVLADTGNPGRFSPQDLDQVAFFGTQAAVAITNAQLVTDMRLLNEELDERVVQRTQALGEERDRVQYLLRVTQELSASLDQDRVLVRALELVNEVVNATHGTILLVDAASGELIYPSAFETHRLPPLPPVDLGLQPEKGLAGWVIDNRQPIVIKDTQEDERWNDQPTLKRLRSALAVPLIAGDEVIGLLTLFHEEPEAFTQEQLGLVEAAASQVASAISNSQLYLLIRVQAERLGRMLREEHIESAKSQAILESIADGVLVANKYGQVILANLPASQILEIPRDRLLGKSVDELLGLYSLLKEEFSSIMRSWLTRNAPREPRQYIAERVNIEEKVVGLHLSPVFSNEEFIGTVSIFRDVSKEVEVDRMKSEFVSTVSHELRTPMTSVKGYAELMLMGAAGELTEAQQSHLRVIANNADRMSELVNNLLDISRIESGKSTLDLGDVEMGETIQTIVEEYVTSQLEHEEKTLEFVVEISPALPKIRADQDRVTQILTNLVDNAVHYTPDSGKITIRAWQDGEFIITSVEDTGIGISSEDRQKIFERFFRSNEPKVQTVPGTGLGLPIVRSLVEMHGGTIDVESSLGKGSVFTFYLPISKSTERVLSSPGDEQVSAGIS